MDWSRFLTYLLVMAGVTYLIRMLPLAAIRGRVRSVFLQSFLYYVPYAVLGAMTFPAVFSATGSWFSALAGTLAALVLGWMEKGLLTVAAVACAVAFGRAFSRCERKIRAGIAFFPKAWYNHPCDFRTQGGEPRCRTSSPLSSA